MTQRQRRVRDEKHLRFIRSLACVRCGCNTSTEAAHVRYSCQEVGKRHCGIAEKPDDKWTVPLCSRCHFFQHNSSERLWWDCNDIDPIKVCQELYEVSGDHAKGSKIVAAYRTKFPIH